MFILLEVLSYAIAAILTSRFAPEPWRSRGLSVIKVLFTVRAFWLLLMHPIAMEDGSKVIAWQLIADQLARIDAGTFWLFVLIGTSVKIVGMLASMYRWILVLRGQGIVLPFWHVFGSFLIGRAIGTFLPSTAGLDGYTLYDAARFSGKTVEVTAGKFLEKICGFSGVFMTYLVALPFGMSIFGDQAGLVAATTVPVAGGIIAGLVMVLWFPGIISWGLEHLPIPGKARLEGVVMRISHAASAYRDKKSLVVLILLMSFLVHFTTAALYYFTAVAIGAQNAEFWQIVFGSSIQILATVVSPFTIAGEGIREAAQYLLLGHLIGPAAAIVSAALGFWAAEAPTMLGFVFWWVRPKDYTPKYCLVDGAQVDYEEAAKAALALETEEERAAREARARDGSLRDDVPGAAERIFASAGFGLGAGVIAGLLIGAAETVVIAAGGFGDEAQVLWYGPLAYATVLGGLCGVGGVVLGVLPMTRAEIRGWTPSLAMLFGLVPLGLFITVFRLRRDVYLEQMPPLPLLLGVLAGFGLLALVLFFGGRRIFGSPLGNLVKAPVALGLLAVVCVGGAIAHATMFGGGGEAPGAATVPGQLKDRPNLILVMVDTLRADHLSCYGATDVKTPNLCRLAEDGGTVFQGWSHASWTKPATASLLTSLLPSSHNAMSKPSRLSDEIDFVAEVLQEQGYTTGGIVSNINLAESFGFDQGYDEYHYLAPSYIAGAQESSSKLILYQLARQIVFRLKGDSITFDGFYQDSEVVNGVAFDWLDRNGAGRFFLFLHYMDPHDPYFAHPYDGTGIARVSNQHPDASLAEEMQRLYKGEIEHLDANFGKLLAKLEAMGIYDDTTIVLTADHGEEFYEHEGWWHGLTLYEEQIHVPLLVKWQKGSAPVDARSERIGRLIDVAPTLINLAGAEVPPAMQGVDLAADPSLLPAKDQQVYSEEDHEGNVLWSLRTKDWKLIRANPGNPRGLQGTELYEVGKDAKETVNVAGAENAYMEDELAQQAAFQKSFAEGEAVAGGGEADMTLEECRQLLNLGYVEDCSHLN